MKERGSTPNLSTLYQFRTIREGSLTLEEAKLQILEIKRLAELKAEKEKLKMVLTPEQQKAQEEELAAYEVKRAKRMEEYNHCITFRDNPLPITKFSYRVNNSTKEATMRITRNNQPLNLKIYDKFVFKKLGFTKNLALPKGVVGKVGLVIRETEAGIFLYNGNFDLVYDELIYEIESRLDFVKVREIIEKNLDGMD
uniref:Uncharacterized protein n=1 Tax=Tanacetum cinerariifolium TaxID=118510 RepID=A0A699HTL7_TANCI|nr:hypothetical protein [Tanacetum cinerariifolium]